MAITSACCLLLILNGAALAQQTFTVNSEGDSSNETIDGECDTGDTIDINGDQALECTFRAALEEVEAGSGEFVIEFSENIQTTGPGNSTQIDNISEPLPEINSQLTIAGETHPEYDEDDDEPKVLIFSELGGDTGTGLRITEGADDTVIRHISVGLFENNGILIDNVEDVEIRNNEIGYHAGFLAFGNDLNGIEVSNSNDVIIDNNTIIYNDARGVFIHNNASVTRITNNYIGIFDDNGDYEVASNESGGVLIEPSAGDDNLVGRCYVSGIPPTGACDGNTISGNEGPGVELRSDNQRVVANNIGTDPDGNGDFGNEEIGIHVDSDNNVIGQSFAGGEIGSAVPGQNISGNNSYGVIIEGSGNTVHNNYVGTNEDGDDIGNESHGVDLESGGDNDITDNDIRFNEEEGIRITSNSDQGEFTGNSIKSNENNGVHILGANGSIDIGSVDGDPNIIGNNEDHGISITGSVDQIRVLGNYIGTNADGDDLGNDLAGISVGFGISPTDANTIEIGNTDTVNEDSDDAANVIGFNQNGINLIYTNDQEIQGNYIGTNAEGDNLGNNINGVRIGDLNRAQGNVIGYSEGSTIPDNPHPAEGNRGNVIAYNNSNAVDLFENDGENKIENSIRGNIISDNDYGISLGEGGDEIDPGGGEEGPNNLQNFPEFDEDETEYDADDNEMVVNFRVQTNTGNANYPLEIDFYLADGEDRQGKTYLGTVDYSDANSWVFETFNPPADVDISSGDLMVATATDGDGNTSEFSNPVDFSEAAPEIAVSDDELDFGSLTEGESATETLTVENDGDADLEGEVTLEDSDGDVFEITSGEGSFDLSPSDEMDVEVEFTPDDVDNFSGQLDIEHNADNEDDPFEVDLTGEGAEEPEPVIAVSDDELDFGSLTEGESATETLTVENDGDADLEGEVTLEDSDGDVFEITSGEGSFDLSPSDEMDVEVEFTPDDVDNFSGQLDIEHNADNEDDPFEVDLTGEGAEEPEPVIAVSDDELDFGSLTEGESATETLTVENDGDADLEGEVTLEDSDGDVFEITSGEGSFDLSPSDEMDVEVKFAPDEVDNFSGQLDIEHNADNEDDPFEVDLTGEGAEDVQAPGVVELESPEDDAEGVDRTPEFTWEKTDEAEEYHLEVADDPNFSELIIEQTASETSYTPEDALEADQTHYWRVRASNAGGEGDWSDIWSFTTEPNIEPFTLESPEDGSEVHVDGTPDDEIQIEWEQPESVVQDELSFVWLLSEDGGFDNPDLEIQSDNDGNATTLTLTYQELDDFLDANGISEGEELEGQWTARAEYEQTDQEAEEPFEVTLVRGEVTSSEEIDEVPEDFTLKQNYPNPFNPSTQIRFELPEDAEVSLRVYNSVGQEVATLIDETRSAGSYEVTFNADDLSSGNYIYRLEADDHVLTRTMTFIK